MAVSLGLGLGVSVSGTTSGVVPSFLYLMAQDGDILEAQFERGSPHESPALILYEPNDIPSDIQIDPTNLLLTQTSNVLFTEAGKGIAIELDLYGAKFITQDKELILTQGSQQLVSQELQPDVTIQEFTTQDGRFLFTQSGDQLSTE